MTIALPIIKEFDAPNPKGLLKKKSGTHKIAYYEWGEKGDENTIVCVHGITRNARDFDYLADALAKDGRHVICVDIAGRGKSEWLTKPKWYGYSLYCTDVLALMKYLNLEKIDWIGTSMGGLMGMIIASNPKKSHIEKMVINDISPFIPKEALNRIGTYVGQNMSFDNRKIAEVYFREYLKSFGVKKEEHWTHLFQHSFFTTENGSYHLSYDPHIGDAFWDKKGKQREIEDMDLWKMWNKVKCKTLFLRGGKSDIFLKSTAEKLRTLPNVHDVIEFEGIGHAPSLMEDDQINIIKDFLSNDPIY